MVSAPDGLINLSSSMSYLTGQEKRARDPVIGYECL
jgi:hypothetical protein